MKIEKDVKLHKIEKGVKLPQKNSYPFKEMKVGDSFSFDASLRQSVATNSIRYTKQYAGIQGKSKFSVRKDPLDENKCRCWRIK